MESELITELYKLLHCDKCNKVLDDNNRHWIESEWLDLCEECFNKEYFLCDNCNEDYKYEIGYYNEELDEQYCTDCYYYLKANNEVNW